MPNSAIRVDSESAWLALHRSFRPDRRKRAPKRAGNIAGLNLIHRVSMHHNWPGVFGVDSIPEGAVRLRVTPEGYVVEE